MKNVLLLVCIMLLAGCNEETWEQSLQKRSQEITTDLQKHPGFEACQAIIFESSHINNLLLFRCADGSIAVIK